jgi:neutral ceramidase
MLESTEIIGRKQYEHSLHLLEQTGVRLSGTVDYRHSFIDMSNLKIVMESNETVTTCPAALGYSFASGTTDGPGEFTFAQGTNSSNPFWNMLSGFLSKPTQEQINCQAPKPILLNTGKASMPYKWDPAVVPIALFRIGNVFILSVPAEFTTMAGRRLRRAIKEVFERGGVEDPVVVIAGLANSYTHYVTTVEEYGGQRYEAASTLYGPHTLSGYLQEFRRIAADMLVGRPSFSKEGPQNLSNRQISLIPPVEVDTIGIGRRFGSVAIDANDQYRVGETVAVSFRSANPRNNQRLGGSFLTIDIMDNSGIWQTRFVDSDWCTEFQWKGGLGRFGVSFAEIFWKIPEDTDRGLYRICHYGTRKTLLGNAEAAFYYAPAWLTSSILGSHVLSLALESLRVALRFSEFVRQKVSGAFLSRYRDFQGCSRTFLVH